jgi:hypothetical protein
MVSDLSLLLFCSVDIMRNIGARAQYSDNIGQDGLTSAVNDVRVVDSSKFGVEKQEQTVPTFG